MDRQILLNVNFYGDARTAIIDADGKRIKLTAGYSLRGLKLVPQENMGICVICADGKNRVVDLGCGERADDITGSCSFVIIEMDESFSLQGLSFINEESLCGMLDDKKQENIDVMLDRIQNHLKTFQSILDRQWETDSRVKRMAGLIYESDGQISVPELADHLGCTVRHVHRLFIENLGIGPKTFARIVRIRNTTLRMIADPYGHVMDYMNGMGYSDQAHFQREFKWYTGMTPGRFLDELRMGTKKQTVDI